jgi:hypothetical protein
VCPAIRKKTYGCLRAAVPHSLQISCAAEPATLEAVQSVIAKQLAVELDTVHPGAKFADLGADSLDTVSYQTMSQMIISTLSNSLFHNFAIFCIQMIGFS